MKYLRCITCDKRAARFTVVGNAVLVVLKASAGIIGGSHALVADAIHSGADIIIALVTLIALTISGKGQDEDYPYGHGKIEYIAAAIVTAGLLIAVVFLFKAALYELRLGITVRPRLITFIVACISIAGNEFMFRYNNCAGKELKSPALIANAWHNRYDAYTSLVVAIGILVAMAGLDFFDHLAALIVGVVIIKISITIFLDAYTGLMDKAIPQQEKQEIEAVVMRVKGIKRVARVKGRRMGQKLWIDLVVELVDSLTVSQIYKKTQQIKEAILFNIGNIEDVQIETNPK